ncbi:MAG: FixH family protein, partial [Pseudomonadota bacterium]
MTNTRGHLIPFMIIAFFVGLAVLMVDLVTVARHSYPGEITTDAYKKGLQYNQAIDRTQLQENLGWNGEAKVSWQDLDVNVNFTLKDKNGEKIKDAKVDAWFI